MAYLKSIVTGNWLTASTWGLIDATSLSDSQAANTVLTTSYVESSTFSFPSPTTVSEIAVKIALRSGTTGTISVHLAISGVEVVGSAVTINVSDLVAGDTAANNGVGWYSFKLATPLVLASATPHSVGAKTSSASQVNLYSATAANWSRALVTTTMIAPVAADTIIIAGAWTAAATSSSYVVTMNETATTSYGAISICDKGTLRYGTAASTAYYLKTSGILRGYGGGAFNMGTVATKMPSTSSGSLLFACVSAGDFGIECQNGASFVVQGNPLSFVKTKLAADVSVQGFLLHMNGANASTTFTDSGPSARTVTAVGDAKLDTSQLKFGSASGLFDGTGDYITLDGAAALAAGIADFKYESFIRFNSMTGAQIILDFRPSGTAGAYPCLYKNVSSTVLKYHVNSTDVITTTTSLVINTWYHIALSRKDGIIKLFVNGVQEGVSYTDANNYLTGASRPVIGASGNSIGTSAFNGWMDEVQYVKGLTNYSGNFTPPVAEFATSANSLTTTDSTGWLSGDVLVLASTSLTRTEAESVTASGNASGTSISSPVTTNGHGGNSTTGVQGEIGNLTRNCKIFGTSASVTSYILIRSGATVDIDYGEFYFLGTNVTNKRAFDIQTTASGNTNIAYSSLYSSTVGTADGFYMTTAAGDNVTLDNNVVYNISNMGVNFQATSGTANTVTNNLIVGCGGMGLNIEEATAIVNGNTSTSNGSYGFRVSCIGQTYTGTFSNNTAHSNANVGMYNNSPAGGTYTGFTSWRNVGYAVQIDQSPNPTMSMIFDSLTTFGNSSGGLGFGSGSVNGLFIIKSMVSNGGTTLTQPYAIVFGTGIYDQVLIQDCSFGATTVHTTADILLQTGYYKVIDHNCFFGSSTEIAGTTSQQHAYYDQLGIVSMKHDQTAGDERMLSKFGIGRTDTTFFNTASPSQRLTPNSATVKLRSGSKPVAVLSGNTVAVTVGVRKSVVGDGTAYNGAQPRLMVRANPSIGIASDTVLATATAAANGAWETLSGTTAAVSALGVLEFFVDCDGSLGWINVDD